uniref:Uncharacterized protein n=1 Tax=Trypanosoma congolense (strain IL3000) TaxID=1068625 RepID=G0UZ68_TRYCI|nr:conserved hypothetical protein [Trypanosoma congolense IL3000]
MESAACELLQLVRAYAVHPCHSVVKFTQTPQLDGQVDVALGSWKLLERIDRSACVEKRYLCEVLIRNFEVHEASVGAACRIDFIAYIVLHVFHTLTMKGLLSLVNDATGNVPTGTGAGDSFLLDEEVEFGTLTKRCCWRMMKSFIRRLHAAGCFVDPCEVMSESLPSVSLKGVESSVGSAVFPTFPSVPLIRQYLQRTFAHDPSSWGYEAATLATDCFMHIYQYLLRLSGKNSTGQQPLETGRLRELADSLLCRVSDNTGGSFVSGGAKGCVIPGIAFIATSQVNRSVGVVEGTCLLSPFYRWDTLLYGKNYHTGALLLISQYPDVFEGENDEGLRHLFSLVRSVREELVVIVVRGYVCSRALSCMETWGSDNQAVLVASAVGNAVMKQLALAFQCLPRALGSPHVKPCKCLLRAKEIQNTKEASQLGCGKARMRSFLLSLAPAHSEMKDATVVIPHAIVSVFLGGRCTAETALLRRFFQRQLDHLINVFCTSPPVNSLLPAGGMAESLAVSFLDNLIEQRSVDGSPFGMFMVTLAQAMRDAINSYMEDVLKRSGGFTVENAVAHLKTSEKRFQNVDWFMGDKFVGSDCTNDVAGNPDALRSRLYSVAVPTPPLMGILGTSGSVDCEIKSTCLLSDVREWESIAEVASAYLCIGRCIDTFCFTDVIGG